MEYDTERELIVEQRAEQSARLREVIDVGFVQGQQGYAIESRVHDQPERRKHDRETYESVRRRLLEGERLD